VKITEVAAAVIERPDGTFLLAQRPEGKPYPGYWEFPGGKIEAGEDVATALARELKEELGIEVRESMPWITRVYAYTHATVRLHFWRVTRWDGEPQRLEDQDIKWQRVEAPDVSPMLPANAPVLAALALPAVMIVSDASRMGIDAWIGALAKRALDEKMLVQVREKSMDKQKLQHVLSRALAERDPGQVVMLKSALGAVATALLAATFGEPMPSASAALALLAIGATGYGLSLRAYLLAQRSFGAARTGSVFAFAPFIGATVAVLLGDRSFGWPMATGGALMLAGVALHLAESHSHEHRHEPLEHEHAHVHDDGHHAHRHDPMPVGAHSHPHRHEPMRHAHPHVPDAHHGHRH